MKLNFSFLLATVAFALLFAASAVFAAAAPPSPPSPSAAQTTVVKTATEKVSKAVQSSLTMSDQKSAVVAICDNQAGSILTNEIIAKIIARNLPGSVIIVAAADADDGAFAAAPNDVIS